jgi:hypothetical protein
MAGRVANFRFSNPSNEPPYYHGSPKPAPQSHCKLGEDNRQFNFFNESSLGANQMKMKSALGLFGILFFVMGCGGLSSADKTTAARAAASIMTLGSTGSHSIAQTLSKIQARVNAHTTCTPGTTSSGGVTFTTACPASGATEVTISAAGPLQRTCGGETITVQDITATISFTSTSSVFTINSSIAATANAKALACQFAASVDFSSSATTVSDSGYACTYDGKSLDKSELEKANCTT